VAFVTSGSRDATSTDIQDYHDFVASQAAGEPILASLGTEWKAIVATNNATSAKTNSGTTGVGVPIYLLDGSSTPLVNNHDDLWDGSLDKNFNVDQHGDEVVGSISVWTGSWIDGIDKVIGLGGGEISSFGRTDSSSTTWVFSSWDDNTDAYPLYAVSGPLTAVPEPSAILCLGLVGLGLAGRRRLKNSK
jgi:hypothetical protein